MVMRRLWLLLLAVALGAAAAVAAAAAADEEGGGRGRGGGGGGGGKRDGERKGGVFVPTWLPVGKAPGEGEHAGGAGALVRGDGLTPETRPRALFSALALSSTDPVLVYYCFSAQEEPEVQETCRDSDKEIMRLAGPKGHLEEWGVHLLAVDCMGSREEQTLCEEAYLEFAPTLRLYKGPPLPNPYTEKDHRQGIEYYGEMSRGAMRTWLQEQIETEVITLNAVFDFDSIVGRKVIMETERREQKRQRLQQLASALTRFERIVQTAQERHLNVFFSFTESPKASGLVNKLSLDLHRRMIFVHVEASVSDVAIQFDLLGWPTFGVLDVRGDIEQKGKNLTRIDKTLWSYKRAVNLRALSTESPIHNAEFYFVQYPLATDNAEQFRQFLEPFLKSEREARQDGDIVWNFEEGDGAQHVGEQFSAQHQRAAEGEDDAPYVALFPEDVPGTILESEESWIVAFTNDLGLRPFTNWRSVAAQSRGSVRAAVVDCSGVMDAVVDKKKDADAGSAAAVVGEEEIYYCNQLSSDTTPYSTVMEQMGQEEDADSSGSKNPDQDEGKAGDAFVAVYPYGQDVKDQAGRVALSPSMGQTALGFAQDNLPARVVVIDEKQVQRFFMEAMHLGLLPVLLLTNKETPTPLLRNVALTHQDKIAAAMVSKPDQRLMASVSVRKLPALVSAVDSSVETIHNPKAGPGDEPKQQIQLGLRHYERRHFGPLNYDNVNAWIERSMMDFTPMDDKQRRRAQGEHVPEDEDGGQQQDGSSTAEAQASDLNQDLLPPNEFVELNATAWHEEDPSKAPCSAASGALCVISFTSGMPETFEEETAAVRAVFEKERHKSSRLFRFMHVNAQCYQEFADAFDIQPFKLPAVALLSRKKALYAEFVGALRAENLQMFLRGITSGRITTGPLRKTPLDMDPAIDCDALMQDLLEADMAAMNAAANSEGEEVDDLMAEIRAEEEAARLALEKEVEEEQRRAKEAEEEEKRKAAQAAAKKQKKKSKKKSKKKGSKKKKKKGSSSSGTEEL